MTKALPTIIVIVIAIALVGAAAPIARRELPKMPSATGRVRAPDFPAGFSWFNTDRPLSFGSDLEGRVVVIDFWTYCCINCMHMLPELARVEAHYKGRPVVVVGVHSNKFTNEADAANVRSAILRYEVQHPVVVDEGHRIWDAYTVRAWPTLMFVDPAGRVVGRLEGESSASAIIEVVDRLLDEGRAGGTLAAGPPALRPEKMIPSMSGLAFPGKVLADAQGGRLFIADSGHNRIVEASLGGRIQKVYGSGEAGLADGPAGAARFRNPQGMALDADAGMLFVADTDNHALRRIALATGDVKTISGNGTAGRDREGGGVGTAQALSSPWALALDKDTLYVAMAGIHQIWVYDRASGRARAWAGSGIENIRDGALESAALAQPSGLSLAAGRLYFADSEVSAIRYADLAAGRIHTLIGTGLFDFGDRAGSLPQALLQHPLGVAADEKNVYVADTYNHKVKRIDLAAGRIETIYGGDKKELYEPGGLSLAAGKLYIADTNHHRVVVMDVASRAAVELALMGWPGEAAPKEQGERKTVAIGPLKAGAEARLVFDIQLPDKTKVNALAPMTVRIAPVSGAKLLATGNGALQATAPTPELPLEVRLPVAAAGEGVYDVDMTFAYCTESDQSLCIPASLHWRAKLTAAQDGATEARLNAQIQNTGHGLTD